MNLTGFFPPQNIAHLVNGQGLYTGQLTYEDIHDLSIRNAMSNIRVCEDANKKINSALIASREREEEMERREKYRVKREFETYEVFQDSQGSLCRALVDDEGRAAKYKRVCDALNLATIMCVAFRDQERCAFYIVTSQKKRLFCLPEDCWNPDEMARAFVRSGFPLQTSRERRKNLNDLVFSFLCNNKEVVEIPYSSGWNKYSTGEWAFATSSKNTMEEVKGWKI